MSYNIVYTHNFARELKWLVKRHKSLKRDIDLLISQLESNPFLGESLGSSCYKIRLAISSKGKGRSGGARVITCAKIVSNRVYLLSIYDKSDKDSISDKELKILLLSLNS